MTQQIVTRRHGKPTSVAEGRGLILHLKSELLDIGYDPDKDEGVVISVVVEDKEKHIVIERLTLRG